MDFSVIIAVRNEKKTIGKCLESISKQNYSGSYEIIVVDGMSSDGTYQHLQELKNIYDFKLYKNPIINAAAGRNMGIKHSNGKLIAFIDGDAIADKNWLSSIISVFKRHGNKVAGVGGPDLLPIDSSDKERFIGLVMTSPLARGGKLNPSTQHSLSEKEESVGHIPTCNLCLQKQVLDEMNGFDEYFVKGQDLELNHRIKKAGYILLYSPEVKVVHYRKNSIQNFARQIYKWAKAKVAIIKKHGMQGFISHVYLWPLYSVIILAFSFIFFSLFSINLFIFMLFLGFISYIGVIFVASETLAKKFNEKKLIGYGLLLFPIIHISYFLGVLSALFRKKIW